MMARIAMYQGRLHQKVVFGGSEQSGVVHVGDNSPSSEAELLGLSIRSSIGLCVRTLSSSMMVENDDATSQSSRWAP